MKIESNIAGFLVFIREQGVVGLAIGFILGGAVSNVVKAFVDDIINPLIALLFGNIQNLSSWMIGPVALGDFVSILINFIIVAAVVYFMFKGLGFEKLDKKKD